MSRKRLKLDQIVNGLLYLSDWSSSCSVNLLKEKKINIIINLHEDEHDKKVEGIKYHHFKITDYSDSDIKSLFPEIIDIIENAKFSRQRVLVHCLGGISRSSTVVIAYIMKTMKYDADEARRHVKSFRSEVHPNRGFMDQLEEYETELEDKRKRVENISMDSYF